MVYYSRRQCSSPDDCAEGAHSQTLSPTVERVFNTIGASRASVSCETLAVTRRIDGVELDAIDAPASLNIL